MNTPPIVSPEEWIAARQKLLVKEKEYMRAGDALAAERRRMPWMAVEKGYKFDGPDGRRACSSCSTAAASWSSTAPSTRRTSPPPEAAGAYPERACVGCSIRADQVAHPAHLNARDTTLAFVSRAPRPRSRT